jgi:hypothetical protein
LYSIGKQEAAQQIHAEHIVKLAPECQRGVQQKAADANDDRSEAKP